MMISGFSFFYIMMGYMRRFSQPFRTDGAKHQQKIGTPTMGGVLIILPVLLKCISFITHPVWFVLCSFGLLGLADDWLKVKYTSSSGISAKIKFISQIVLSMLALVLCDLDTHLTYNNISYDLGILYYVFAVFIIVASSNAMNLTDGIDGLATSQMIIMLLFLGVYAQAIGNESIVLFTLALLSMAAVFLCFNWHPASIFMGDVGSLSIGAVIGLMAVILKLEIWYALASVVLIGEVVSVIIQVGGFKIGYGRLFRMAPYHHHLELKGWSELEIVFSGMCVTTVMGLIAAWLLWI